MKGLLTKIFCKINLTKLKGKLIIFLIKIYYYYVTFLSGGGKSICLTKSKMRILKRGKMRLKIFFWSQYINLTLKFKLSKNVNIPNLKIKKKQ